MAHGSKGEQGETMGGCSMGGGVIIAINRGESINVYTRMDHLTV